VGARKVGALLESGATVRVVTTHVGPELRAQLGGKRLTVVERHYESGDIGDATLVVAATNSREVNARVAADARAGNRLVNVADVPTEGDWVTAATHRAGPLVISVSAGGVPSAAARIRDAAAERFDARYGAALSALAVLRGRLLASGDAEVWREADTALIGPDFCARVERGAFASEMAAWR
jgi:precorrin-2 dehydrogenase/sirohydrochlorin ferrochelatase